MLILSIAITAVLAAGATCMWPTSCKCAALYGLEPRRQTSLQMGFGSPWRKENTMLHIHHTACGFEAAARCCVLKEIGKKKKNNKERKKEKDFGM